MFIVNVEGAVRRKVLWLTTEEIINHPQVPFYLKTSIIEAESKKPT